MLLNFEQPQKLLNILFNLLSLTIMRDTNNYFNENGCSLMNDIYKPFWLGDQIILYNLTSF